MFGLLLATADSVVNVLTDVARKKVLDRQFDAALVTCWAKFISCLVFVAVLAALHWGWGTPLVLPDIGRVFEVSPRIAFLLYLSLNGVVEGAAILLYLRALQVSPISYCIPFLAFTPLFLLPTGIIFLHEAVTGGMVVGVSLVVIGALVMNRQMFSRGLFEPVRAIVRERGSRYMLMVAVLLTITNLLDKWFLLSGGGAVPFTVKLARSVTLSLGKCAMLTVFFIGLTVVRTGDWPAYRRGGQGLARLARSVVWGAIWRAAPVWLALAGVLDSLVLVLQLTAMQFIVAAIAISIKRAGMILAVGMGWFVFKERGITDRVIAALVMTAGVLIFFLTNTDGASAPLIATGGAIAVAAVVLLGMGAALLLTRRAPAEAAAPLAEGQPKPAA